jgi:hypothetical protein
MDRATPIASLGMFTLVASLLFIVVGFYFYWRKRSNRAPSDSGPSTKDRSV